MWRSKKLIIIAVVAALVLAGSIGGVALAQTENGDESQPEAERGALLDRICEIYEDETGVTIDQEALKDAFAQAGEEMRLAAMESRLQYLVEQDKITQDEADQLLEWWQAKPDVLDGFGFQARGRLPGRCGMFGWGKIGTPEE